LTTNVAVSYEYCVAIQFFDSRAGNFFHPLLIIPNTLDRLAYGRFQRFFIGFQLSPARLRASIATPIVSDDLSVGNHLSVRARWRRWGRIHQDSTDGFHDFYILLFAVAPTL